MAVTKTKTAGSSTSEERTGKRAMWGDNNAARIPTQAYKDNYDAIFGKKDKKVVDNT